MVCTLLVNKSSKGPSNRIKAFMDVTPKLADAARALKDELAEGANKPTGLAVFHDSWTQIRVSMHVATVSILTSSKLPQTLHICLVLPATCYEKISFNKHS